ncbi:phosphoribosylanthranilate isomerase [Chryseobacterium piperi]|uniref:N-(5'-phosphoribosyl)anthranilate isomerase n=1 Tax=Chryseobacterium piperi TaxID=558152 RepID=A0A086BMK3_9FLAO|nr:phosphoribosylanthranilate isomerase [Chryseobacterium piperi]ATL75947.1 phosphoribosylanthranilate isomerase [Chryseobacterium piperi]KFF30167.1 phosphoribosylanthranilate isomerase [Chryseobacterium piperi]
MNQPLQLKVCGLTQINQIQELISLNTDFLGFIFYKKSPRYVLNHLNLEDLFKINHSGKVGVFVNEDVGKVAEIVKKGGLNFIQLHGDENEDYILELRKKTGNSIKIIKVLRIGTDPFSSNKKYIDSIRSVQQYVNYLLFDTDSQSFGGTGKQFGWSLLNEFELQIPYFLSGGISEENVMNIKNLHQKPFALDINSKFETEPGVKNIEKVRLFQSNLTNSNL